MADRNKRDRRNNRPDRRVALRFIDRMVPVLSHAITWAGIVMVARYTQITIHSLAGEETSATFGVAMMTSAEIGMTASVTLGLSGVVYGLAQRKLRKDTVEQMSGHNKVLEENKDRRRSSSRLTPRGENRPEDRR